MALHPFQVHPEVYTGTGIFEAHQQSMSGRSLLTALGDYWQNYFADPDVLQANMAGMNALLSTEYVQLLQTVLNSNIIQIPTARPLEYDLLVFDSSKAQYITQQGYALPIYDPGRSVGTEIYGIDPSDTVNYIAYPLPQGQSLEYLISTLFEPTITLVEGVDYVVENEEIHFFVDIFNDQELLDGVYSTGTEDTTYILFWASNLLLKETYIYERFGTFLYSEEYDSDTYKLIITALQFFFVQTKSVKNIEAIINILYGLPYSRFANDVVREIIEEVPDAEEDIDSSSRYRIITDFAEYQVDKYAELLVGVGDSLQHYQIMARWHHVNDYLTQPNWYEGARIPKDLIVEFTHDSIPSDFYTTYYDAKSYYDGSMDMDHPDLSADPMWNIRSRENGLAYENYLYQLYDHVLKYNIVYFLTLLNFENYNALGSRTPKLYAAIRTGFPSYLYPLFETIFQIVFDDEVPEAELSELIRATIEPWVDEFIYTGDKQYYDGTHFYGSDQIQNIYDGTLIYNSDDAYDNPGTHQIYHSYHGLYTYAGTKTYGPYYSSYDIQYQSDANEYWEIKAGALLGEEFVAAPEELESGFRSTQDSTALTMQDSEPVDEPFLLLQRCAKTAPIEESVVDTYGTGLNYSGLFAYDPDLVYVYGTPEADRVGVTYSGAAHYHEGHQYNRHSYLRYEEVRELGFLIVRNTSGDIIQQVSI